MRDAERFRELYEECYPRVLAYAASQVGRQLGEDVTSETLSIAWRRWPEVPVPPLPWLLGVARNVLRDMRRKQSRQYELAAAVAVRENFASADAGDAVLGRAVVLQALADLSEDDRELLILFAWHGLGARDAARVLGCTTATVTVRLHRARRRLERALAAAELSNEPVRMRQWR